MVPKEELRRRRHSSYHPKSWVGEPDNLHILVDSFLSELNRRLDFIESYGHLKFDAHIERAYNTLLAVRDSCSRVSDGMIDAGRRRASVLVDTLEERYNDALSRRDSLEQKALEGVRFMESMLAEFEARAYAVKDSGLGAAAHDFLDEGWRRMDKGMGKAKEAVDEGIEKARRAKEAMKGTLQFTINQALKQAKQHGLISYDDLPVPWRVNPHIHSGYRFSDSKIDCVRSMLSVSNELVNIWSHAIGFLMVVAIAFYYYPTSANFSSSTKSDIFVAAMFFIAACKCLVCSTVWHTFNSIAEQDLLERFACVDYTGISLLVACSIMSTEYTAFYCEPVSRWAYMLTTFALGIGGVILPWHPTFNRSDMAWARVLFYSSLASTGFIPAIQLTWTRGFYWAAFFYAPIVKSVAVYLVGAILYAAKIPERFFPGTFDYFGGSHNIWHFAVVGGILFHYFAMQEFFRQAFARAQLECSIY
ncbi:adiponectin receptor protein 1 [Aulographum hederae CBS 113979]|uniref:Adiponectin receptor protein 1 n=1 Tax=Aulographum hederae CBS 113979 TaxID=1176131 RepID=A0A6G1GV24_9PEZI|nr:adiponectin receptor protein 1 [Aulographum hederae CBS 113979]